MTELKATDSSARTSEACLMRKPTSATSVAPSVRAPKSTLLQQVRQALRARYCSRRTEEAYVT